MRALDDGWLYPLTSSASTRVMDLACSGAKTLDVLNTGADWGTQPAEGAALAATASANRVTAVVVQASATRAGAEFVDLSTSMAGHEACTGGADPGGEWQNRLAGPRGTGAAFHPTTPGYTRVASLLDPVLAG